MIFCLLQDIPKMHPGKGVFNEDLYFSYCLKMYEHLFRIAPTNIAKSFSSEESPNESVFGLHDICRVNPCMDSKNRPSDAGRVPSTVETRNKVEMNRICNCDINRICNCDINLGRFSTHMIFFSGGRL